MDVGDFIQANPYFRKSRLTSLYSDFEKNQTLNPEGYHANIEAWGNLLNLLIKQGMVIDSGISIPTHNPDLYQYLSLPTVGSPKCLGVILNELVAEKQLVPLSSFLNESRSYVDIMSNNHSIFTYLQPNHWFLWLKGDYNSQTRTGLKQERYISWDALNKQSKKTLTFIELVILHGTIVDRLFDFELLLTELQANSQISSVDLTTLLKYWQRDLNKCQTRVENGKTYIKFSHLPISDDDIGIIELKTSIEDLSFKNLQTEVEIDKLNVKLKDLVAKKADTNRIKHFLKLRKMLLQALEKSTDSYNQLSSILLKIEESNINLGVYDQLVAGRQVLQSMNSKFDLDEIEEVKNQVDEEMAKADDITQALTNSKDDIDVDEEFEALLKEAVSKEDSVKGKEDTEDSEDTKNKEDNIKGVTDQELLNKLESLTINKQNESNQEESTTEQDNKLGEQIRA